MTIAGLETIMTSCMIIAGLVNTIYDIRAV